MTRPPVRGDDDWAAGDGDDGGRRRRWADDGAEWAEDDAGADGGAPAYEYVTEYEELRPEPKRGRRVLIVVAVLVVVFVVVAGAAGFYIRGQLDPPGPAGRAVQFTIESGSSSNAVASDLEEQGIIRDAQAFRMYLRFKGSPTFEHGDYSLHLNMAAWDVLDVLEQGPAPIDTARFTVPPGLTLIEIPGAIVDDIPSFDAAVIAQVMATDPAVRPASLEPGRPLEGFLFPDTYEIRPGDGEAAAILRMAQQMDQVIAELDVPARAAALNRTTYEIITIASLIQEEYGTREEMPKIARVIYNRLDMGEPLGIDATSRYEAMIAGRDRNDIDFESDSAYNTRRHAGLPPTPIAAPDRDAINAALSPADGPWIYYVRDPDTSRTPEGGHFFTDSAREFQAVKAQCEAADLGCG